MSNSSDKNNESSLCLPNEIKTTNEQSSRVVEQSTELGSKYFFTFLILNNFS